MVRCNKWGSIWRRQENKGYGGNGIWSVTHNSTLVHDALITWSQPNWKQSPPSLPMWPLVWLFPSLFMPFRMFHWHFSFHSHLFFPFYFFLNNIIIIIIQMGLVCFSLPYPPGYSLQTKYVMLRGRILLINSCVAHVWQNEKEKELKRRQSYQIPWLMKCLLGLWFYFLTSIGNR